MTDYHYNKAISVHKLKNLNLIPLSRQSQIWVRAWIFNIPVPYLCLFYCNFLLLSIEKSLE